MKTSSSTAVALLDILPLAGYGLWMLLGASLALDVSLDGRGEMLVPLAFGLLCIGAGWLGALGSPEREWRPPPRDGWPPRESLVAMATFLPMLAVAGLARGDNAFWATRLAGGALAICCLATLLLAPRRPAARAQAASLFSQAYGPLLAGVFSGGLWLWACVALQEPFDLILGVHGRGLPGSWLLALLAAGLAMGLSLRRRTATPARHALAALLSFGIPCLLLSLSGVIRPHVLAPLLAAPACEIGLWLRQIPAPDTAAAHDTPPA